MITAFLDMQSLRTFHSQLVFLRQLLVYMFQQKEGLGLPWWCSDSSLSMQEAQVQSLVRDLDPTCCN